MMRANGVMRGLLGIVALFLLAACGGAATDVPLPDAAETLRNAAAQIQTATALRYKLQLTGAPAYVDYNNVIAFVSADGGYVEPDRVNAKVVAKLGGIPGEVEIVAIGDQQYMKNAILTANQWLIQQFSPGFNAEKLIRSDTGIEAAIRSIQNVKMVGREKLFGADVYHLTGNAAATDIASLTVDLIRGADVTMDIFVNVQTGRVDQVVMVQPETKTDTVDATTWTLELFDYNATNIQIIAPANAQQPSVSGGLPQVGAPLPTALAETLIPTAVATDSIPAESAATESTVEGSATP